MIQADIEPVKERSMAVTMMMDAMPTMEMVLARRTVRHGARASSSFPWLGPSSSLELVLEAGATIEIEIDLG